MQRWSSHYVTAQGMVTHQRNALAGVRAAVKAGIAALVVGRWRAGRGEGWGRALDIRCLTRRVLEAGALHE